MNIRQTLINAGLNVFGADCLAESLLRHPQPKFVQFLLPIRRMDCPGWIGVKITLEPLPETADIGSDAFDPIALGC